ncbi:MAG: inosine monophosphate cyclohydrolase [Candidatus Moranbacteria bacterium]|nr:inosine monophosphate cyclohydrolase [Candidatus Moranbacteria bacterium]
MALAGDNILALAENPYPGRGIVAGLDESGSYMVQVYWITGRSPNSRNRVFGTDDEGRLFTEAADPSKVDDPALIIYNAMREVGLYYVVSNGDQTDTVISALGPNTFSLDLALRGREYEPDLPNFTPRITAVSSIAKGRTALFMSVLRKSPFGEECDRFTYELTQAPGFGYCITTYSGDGDPLPSFSGDPVLMPFIGGIEQIANDYWAALNKENRVSLAVKSIQISSGHSSIHVINKYAKV